MHCASEHGWTDALEKILADAPEDVHAVTYWGQTPLHYATSNGHIASTKILLAHGAVLEHQDDTGWTPLMWAASQGRAETVRYLLSPEVGASQHIQSKDGFYPLHNALLNHGNIETLEVLCSDYLKGGSRVLDDMRTASLDWTPLHASVRTGDAEKVQLMVDQGCSVTLQNRDKWTAAHYAASVGHAHILKLLLDQGADPDVANDGEFYPTHMAACKGNVACLEVLLAAGASPSVETQDRWQPLHWASQMDSPHMVELLLKAGADVNRATVCGWVPVKLATQNGRLSVVKLLVEAGADLKFQCADGWSVLHNATKARRLGPDGVASPGEKSKRAYVVVNGADDNSFGAHYRLQRNVDDPNFLLVAEYLCSKGASVNLRTSREWTPLHTAARVGYTEMVRLFLDNGADIEARTMEGWTPLHMAVGSSSPHALDVVKLLVARGCNTMAKTMRGQSAWQFTKSAKHKELGELLQGVLKNSKIPSIKHDLDKAQAEVLSWERRKPDTVIHPTMGAPAAKGSLSATTAAGNPERIVIGAGTSDLSPEETERLHWREKRPPDYVMGNVTPFLKACDILDLTLDSSYQMSPSDGSPAISVRRGVWVCADWLHLSFGRACTDPLTPQQQQDTAVFDQAYLMSRSITNKLASGIKAVHSPKNFGHCLLNLFSVLRAELYGIGHHVEEADARLLLHLEAVPHGCGEMDLEQQPVAPPHFDGDPRYLRAPGLRFGHKDYLNTICDSYYFTARVGWKDLYTGKVEKVHQRGAFKRFNMVFGNGEQGEKENESDWIANPNLNLIGTALTFPDVIKLSRTTMKRLIGERRALELKQREEEAARSEQAGLNGLSLAERKRN